METIRLRRVLVQNPLVRDYGFPPISPLALSRDLQVARAKQLRSVALYAFAQKIVVFPKSFLCSQGLGIEAGFSRLFDGTPTRVIAFSQAESHREQVTNSKDSIYPDNYNLRVGR